MLIALAGLPATGKSTLASRIAERLDAVVLDKDRIRASLFLPADIDYSGAQNDLCVGVMFEVAGYLLNKDPARRVIIDGRTFSKRYQVQALRDFASQAHTPLAIIECVIADRIAQERLLASVAQSDHLAGNRNVDLYTQLKAQAEPIDGPKLVIDTGAMPLEDCVSQALAYIQANRNANGEA